MDRPRKLAMLLSSPKGTEWPYLSMMGAGTQDLPLQSVLLVRHSDMADETPVSDALVQTSEVAHALGYALYRLTTAEKLVAIRLADTLRTAHLVAAQTGTYYSAIAAVLAGDRLLAAGIGRITVRVQRAERAHELLQPTTHDPSQTRERGLLRAALGIGFSETEVRTCDENIEALDTVMLMIGATDAWKLPSRTTTSPSDVLDHLCGQPNPGVSVAVLVGCESNDDEANKRLHEARLRRTPAQPSGIERVLDQ
jgi:hypothetical protein